MCFDPLARARIRARAAIAAVTDGPRFLIVKQLTPPPWHRHHPHHLVWTPLWKFAGGGLNVGEHPRVGASRELRQETGIFVPAYTFEYLDEREVPSGPDGTCWQSLMGARTAPKSLDRFYPEAVHHYDTADRVEFMVWSIERDKFANLIEDEKEFLPPQQKLARIALTKLPP